MTKKKNSKKCDKKCNICLETACPVDFRISCFGEKCHSCQLECPLKVEGQKKRRERTAESYAATHYAIDKTVCFSDELETIINSEDTTLSPITRARLDVARKMAFFYLEHPTEFDKFVMQFFCGKTQSDIARMQGVSRQNISKKIRSERQEELKKEIDSLKKRNAAFATMTINELKVYRICCIDGVFGASNIAKQAGISRRTVYRVLHRLSEKYGITVTLDKSRKKKI